MLAQVERSAGSGLSDGSAAKQGESQSKHDYNESRPYSHLNSMNHPQHRELHLLTFL